MADVTTSLHEKLETFDRGNGNQRPDNASFLGKVVFVIVLGAAYACAALAIALPIYVWL